LKSLDPQPESLLGFMGLSLGFASLRIWICFLADLDLLPCGFGFYSTRLEKLPRAGKRRQRLEDSPA
jgi:hypothetical protein